MRLDNLVVLIFLGVVIAALPAKKEGRSETRARFHVTTRWFVALVSFCYPMTEHISAFVSNLYNVYCVYDSQVIDQVEKSAI